MYDVKSINFDKFDESQRYQVQKRIGGGGMGEVFLATDTRLGKTVALKLLKESLLEEEIKLRFERELAICAALKSQHIVQVSDYGLTAEGYPFYVMEYLPGQTLRELLQKEGQLSIHQAYHLLTQVCAGLQLAHEGVVFWNEQTQQHEQVKVVHRDLKPDNIFLVPTALGNLVKIIDFGIAKIRSLQVEQTNVTNMFLGTFHYAAPEQIEALPQLDERADIYSLGMILYEILAGVDPFGFNFRQNYVSGESWLMAHITKSPIPLRSQPNCDHLPAELEAVVMRCLEKQPDARFASVAELNQALQLAISTSATALRQGIGQFDAVPPPAALHHSAYPAPVLRGLPAKSARSLSTHSQLYSADSTRLENSQLPHPKGANHSTLNRLKVGLGSSILAALVVLGGYSWNRFLPMNPVASTAAGSSPTLSMNQHTLEQTLEASSGAVWSLALSFDENRLFSSDDDRTIKAWNLETGQMLQTYRGHQQPVVSVSLSPDEQTLISTSFDRTIKFWNSETGTLTRTLNGHQDTVWTAVVSADSKILASASADRTIKLWDFKTGELLQTLTGHTDWVFSVAFSPDGQTLASASKDGTIKLWNVQTGNLQQTLTGHTNAVRSIAFDPTGEQLVSASWDQTLKLWQVSSGQELKTFAGHSDRAVSVVFLPDGKQFASASIDGTVRLWNVAHSTPLETITAHTDWVLAVAANSSGNTLVSSSRDRTIKVWKR